MTRARTDLVPLGPRLGALFGLRFALALVILASTAMTPSVVGTTAARVAPLVGGYLVLTNGAEIVRRLRGRLPVTVMGLLLLVDGAFMAAVIGLTGGPGSALTALLLVHLVAVTLAASYRTGLKLALWDSMLLIVAHHAPPAFGGRSVPLDEAVFTISAFWGVAVAAAAFSALNERDLRRSRRASSGLAAMARQMETTPDAQGVILALLDGVAEQVADRKFSVALIDTPAIWTRVGGFSVRMREPGPALGDHTRAELLARHTLRQRTPTDPLIAHMVADGENILVVPLVADGELLGVLALEWGGGPRETIGGGMVEALEQLVAHGALAYRNAKLVDEVRRLATSDGLTGVANRRTFDETLAREVARASRSGEPLSLVLIDIDHFKAINDRYGHQTGDDVLRHVGRVLEHGARLADLPARYGGEEFALILPGAGPTSALTVAERARAAIATCPYASITASAGVATMSGSRGSADQLIAAADEALYAAKHQGRNRAIPATVGRLSAA